MSAELFQLSQSQANGAWNQPVQIGAVAASQLAAANNADGRLELLAIADGGTVYRCNEKAPGSQLYTTPISLNVQAKRIALSRNKDGRLEFFYLSLDNHVFHAWQTTANSDTWSTGQFGGQAKEITLARNTDGRLELFYVGLDDNIYDFWQTAAGSGIWQGGIFRGKAKKLALATNGDGRLELIYVGMDNGLYHNWQSSPSSGPWQGGVSGATAAGLGGYAKDLAVALNSSNNIEFFYIGSNNAIYHNWQDGNGWHGEASFGGQAQQLCLVHDADKRLELFYVGMDGYIYHNWQGSVNGPWTGGTRVNMAGQLAGASGSDNRIAVFFAGYLNPPTGTVSPPASTTGEYNCILSNGGAALQNPAVVIDITSDIGLVSNGPPAAGQPAVTGYSFQMNCYAPIEYLGNWQQYVVGISGNNLYWQVNNWESLSTIVINQQANFATISNNKLLAGTKITIALRTDIDAHVNGATFSAVDAHGKSLGSHFIDLAGALNPVELAPIAAFEMNLVGPQSSETAILSGGGGTFTYTATVAMTALPSIPDYLATGNIITAEQANSSYGTMSATPSQSLSQAFSIATSTTSMSPVKGRTRPPLLAPRR